MQNFRIVITPVGELMMNSILITAQSPEGDQSLLIDPGAEPEKLKSIVATAGAPLVGIVATHAHFDHIGAAAALQETWDLPLLCHADDTFLIQSLPQIQQAYGFPPSAIPRFDASLEDGSHIQLANLDIKVRHVPGHSPGQLMFVVPGYAIVGDCLFQGSVGRTDLPGGDFDVLAKSIRERIYTLPDETVIICGHGPNTTVGKERTTNPFIRA